MEVEKKVIVEPAGKSEGDWSAAPRSTTGLPQFVEGEYKHMIEVGGEPEEPEDGQARVDEEESDPVPDLGERDEVDLFFEEPGEEPEEDELGLLDIHMTALLDAGGKQRDSDAGESLRERIAARFPRG